jgi:hypothetical protein
MLGTTSVDVHPSKLRNAAGPPPMLLWQDPTAVGDAAKAVRPSGAPGSRGRVCH